MGLLGFLRLGPALFLFLFCFCFVCILFAFCLCFVFVFVLFFVLVFGLFVFCFCFCFVGGGGVVFFVVFGVSGFRVLSSSRVSGLGFWGLSVGRSVLSRGCSSAFFVPRGR